MFDKSGGGERGEERESKRERERRRERGERKRRVVCACCTFLALTQYTIPNLT